MLGAFGEFHGHQYAGVISDECSHIPYSHRGLAAVDNLEILNEELIPCQPVRVADRCDTVVQQMEPPPIRRVVQSPLDFSVNFVPQWPARIQTKYPVAVPGEHVYDLPGRHRHRQSGIIGISSSLVKRPGPELEREIARFARVVAFLLVDVVIVQIG